MPSDEAAANRSPLFLTTFNQGADWLLALHGVTAHGLRFVRLASLLPDIRIVAPDLRGHGRSPRYPPWTIAQHVADLLPLLDRDERPPVVLGHSFGGLIAWELARAAPDRVAGLVLVDSAIGVSNDVARAGKANDAADVSWSGVTAAIRAELAGRSPRGAWAAALDVALAMERDRTGRLHRLALPEAVRCAWDEMLRPLNTSDYRGPTLLIEAAPEQGRYVGEALITGLREQLGVRLHHVKLDSPHSIPAEQPELLARELEVFLRTHS